MSSKSLAAGKADRTGNVSTFPRPRQTRRCARPKAVTPPRPTLPQDIIDAIDALARRVADAEASGELEWLTGELAIVIRAERVTEEGPTLRDMTCPAGSVTGQGRIIGARGGAWDLGPLPSLAGPRTPAAELYVTPFLDGRAGAA